MPTPEPEKRVKRPRLRLPFEKRKQDAALNKISCFHIVNT